MLSLFKRRSNRPGGHNTAANGDVMYSSSPAPSLPPLPAKGGSGNNQKIAVMRKGKWRSISLKHSKRRRKSTRRDGNRRASHDTQLDSDRPSPLQRGRPTLQRRPVFIDRPNPILQHHMAMAKQASRTLLGVTTSDSTDSLTIAVPQPHKRASQDSSTGRYANPDYNDLPADAGYAVVEGYQSLHRGTSLGDPRQPGMRSDGYLVPPTSTDMLGEYAVIGDGSEHAGPAALGMLEGQPLSSPLTSRRGSKDTALSTTSSTSGSRRGSRQLFRRGKKASRRKHAGNDGTTNNDAYADPTQFSSFCIYEGAPPSVPITSGRQSNVGADVDRSNDANVEQSHAEGFAGDDKTNAMDEDEDVEEQLEDDDVLFPQPAKGRLASVNRCNPLYQSCGAESDFSDDVLEEIASLSDGGGSAFFNPYFHGQISRQMAEKRLAKQPEDGSFLLREKDPDKLYVLSVNRSDGFEHHIIQRGHYKDNGEQFWVMNEERFHVDGVDEVIAELLSTPAEGRPYLSFPCMPCADDEDGDIVNATQKVQEQQKTGQSTENTYDHLGGFRNRLEEKKVVRRQASLILEDKHHGAGGLDTVMEVETEGEC